MLAGIFRLCNMQAQTQDSQILKQFHLLHLPVSSAAAAAAAIGPLTHTYLYGNTTYRALWDVIPSNELASSSARTSRSTDSLLKVRIRSFDLTFVRSFLMVSVMPVSPECVCVLVRPL